MGRYKGLKLWRCFITVIGSLSNNRFLITTKCMSFEQFIVSLELKHTSFKNEETSKRCVRFDKSHTEF